MTHERQPLALAFTHHVTEAPEGVDIHHHPTRVRPATILLAALGGALLVTACSDGDPAATTSVTASRSATPSATTTTTGPPSPPPTPTRPATASPASTSSARPSPTTTTAPLVAEPTGLGVVEFGDAEADVMAVMRSRFGAPDADSGWGPAADSPYGVCPGATTGGRVRGARWGRIRLLFSDADTDYGSAGTTHLMAYDLTSFQGSGSAPTTAAGIGLGSTAGQVRDAYGDRAEYRAAAEVTADRFVLHLEAGEIVARLDAPPPDGVVTFLTAGAPCGE